MKILSKIMICFLCVTLFFGCGAKKLSSDYSEDKLKAASEEIIKDLSEEKYDDVTAKLKDDLKEKLPAAKLEEVWANYKKLGKYESLSKIAFQQKDEYAVVVAIAKYKEGKVRFTLSYDKDMKLVGIYMK